MTPTELFKKFISGGDMGKLGMAQIKSILDQARSALVTAGFKPPPDHPHETYTSHEARKSLLEHHSELKKAGMAEGAYAQADAIMPAAEANAKMETFLSNVREKKSRGMIIAPGRTGIFSASKAAPAVATTQPAQPKTLSPSPSPKAVMPTSITKPNSTPESRAAAPVKPSFSNLHGLERVKASMNWDADRKAEKITAANAALNPPKPTAAAGSPPSASEIAAEIIRQQKADAARPTGLARTIAAYAAKAQSKK